MVKQGLLFVWPDENGHELAEKTGPPVTPGKALVVVHLIAMFNLVDSCPAPSQNML